MSYESKKLNVLAELGDYDTAVHTPAFVSEFRFVPEQTEEMEIKIIEEYKKIRYSYVFINFLVRDNLSLNSDKA